MAAMRQPSSGDGYIKLLAWILLVCCWLVQGLAARHSMDADGVSYQNIADAALSGDWRSFLNGYWSPGFPFLLTLWRKDRPSFGSRRGFRRLASPSQSSLCPRWASGGSWRA